MTLEALLTAIGEIGISDRLISFAAAGGSIYELNDLTIRDYPILYVSPTGTHRISENYTTYALTIFYIDRLLEDSSNGVDIHSSAVEILKNIIKKASYMAGVIGISNEYTINLFTETEKMKDRCNGAYATVEFTVINDSTCVIASVEDCPSDYCADCYSDCTGDHCGECESDCPGDCEDHPCDECLSDCPSDCPSHCEDSPCEECLSDCPSDCPSDCSSDLEPTGDTYTMEKITSLEDIQEGDMFVIYGPGEEEFSGNTYFAGARYVHITGESGDFEDIILYGYTGETTGNTVTLNDNISVFELHKSGNTFSISTTISGNTEFCRFNDYIDIQTGTTPGEFTNSYFYKFEDYGGITAKNDREGHALGFNIIANQVTLPEYYGVGLMALVRSLRPVDYPAESAYIYKITPVQ